jgi:hypothetical protein
LIHAVFVRGWFSATAKIIVAPDDTAASADSRQLDLARLTIIEVLKLHRLEIELILKVPVYARCICPVDVDSRHAFRR